MCKRGVREKERESEIERLGKPLKVEKARPASSSVLHSQKEGQRLERLQIKKEEKAEARLEKVKKRQRLCWKANGQREKKIAS